jgi:hypothetical protein
LAEPGFEDCGPVEPTSEASIWTDRGGFAGQGNEDILSHFFGGGPLTEEAKSRPED